MSITPSFRIALAFFILFQTEVQAKNNDPCSDGTLKGWALRAGYSAADCAPAQTPPNTAPAVQITHPADGAQFEEGVVLALSAVADDTQDGDLSTAVVWSPVMAPTAAGTHVITASVSDSGGLTASTQVTITIMAKAPAPVPAPNSAPEITILSPESGAQFNDGMAIDLNATARDAQDGDLSATIVWQPSGSNGGSVVLPTGEHVLTASVTDSGGLTVTRDLVVTVTEPVVATTGSVELKWLIPLTRENGDPLSPSELRGYEIYVVHEESNADRIIAVNDATIDNYVVEDLAEGTHHFAIVAIDINGLKSALSESVSKIVTGGESIVAAQ
jgi:hypothetical protein